MAANGSPPPEFETDEDRSYFITRLLTHRKAGGTLPSGGLITGQVTGQVGQLLKNIKGEMSRAQMQKVLDLAHRDHFTEAYLKPALDAGLIEMTIPDKPRSSKQRYRLTDKGRQWLKEGGGGAP